MNYAPKMPKLGFSYPLQSTGMTALNCKLDHVSIVHVKNAYISIYNGKLGFSYPLQSTGMTALNCKLDHVPIVHVKNVYQYTIVYGKVGQICPNLPYTIVY